MIYYILYITLLFPLPKRCDIIFGRCHSIPFLFCNSAPAMKPNWRHVLGYFLFCCVIDEACKHLRKKWFDVAFA